ncbi:collagen alpha-2(VIII) chain-like [Mya arenaria]|uniref:collagen alpha-2(VIII) chain-like n=1 Tax=Mya arenaria TaxID=6604 RepID=UPI0022E18597|nr:collagen alpha-2(VIII) chain-like [Mya arenaria]
MVKLRTDIQNDLDELTQKKEDFDKHINATMTQHPTVLFRARNVADYTLSTTDQTVIFNEVLYNDGAGYNSATGTFTAPVKGTYLFTVNLCQANSKSIFYAIMIKEDVVANGHTYSVPGFLCVSGDAIVQLDANDVVYVKSMYTSDVLLESGLLNSFDPKANSFSGVLLN